MSAVAERERAAGEGPAAADERDGASVRRNRFLYALVFVVGAASLGAEIAAARLMAPFFGASTIVWANTIGVVLVALSAGYWLGGRLGDRRPEVRSLCLVVAIAAALLAVVPFVAQPFFDVSVDALDEISAGAFVGSLVAVLFLVAVPVLMLGTVSPWAIRLSVPDVEHSGRVAGRLYAISTVGSLVGTMLAALALIPLPGHPADLRRLCDRARARGGARPRLALPGAPDRARRSRRDPSRIGQRGGHRRGDLRGRHRAPVRAGRRAGRRRSPAGAQRGPGGALAVPARRVSDRRRLGRIPGPPVHRARRARRSGSRSSATPPARPPGPTGTISRRRR